MSTLNTFVNDVTDFIGTAVANLFLTLAVVVFFWSVINFMMKRAQGAGEGIKQARDMLGWSIFGLFVMFSIWGIVYFFQNAFQITNQNSISAPSIKVNTANGTAGNGAVRPTNLKPRGSVCVNSSECTSGNCQSGLGAERSQRTCQ